MNLTINILVFGIQNCQNTSQNASYGCEKCRKSNPIWIFLWRTKVSEAVCKRDWHNMRSYLFFNVQKFRTQCAMAFSEQRDLNYSKLLTTSVFGTNILCIPNYKTKCNHLNDLHNPNLNKSQDIFKKHWKKKILGVIQTGMCSCIQKHLEEWNVKGISRGEQLLTGHGPDALRSSVWPAVFLQLSHLHYIRRSVETEGERFNWLGWWR